MKPYYEQDGVTIYHGDCREVLPSIVADVIVTDPPYGTGCAPRGGLTAGSIAMESGFTETWDVFDPTWAEMWGGPMAVFCGIRFVFGMASAIRADGLLIYTKSNPNPLGSSYEPCVTRGFPLRGRQHFEAYNAFNGQVHPTQKPVEVMRWVVGRHPGGVVLDPFMGSGTTLVAAKDLGRRAIGIEIEERYCEIAAERLSQQVLGLEAA